MLREHAEQMLLKLLNHQPSPMKCMEAGGCRARALIGLVGRIDAVAAQEFHLVTGRVLVVC